MTWRRISFQKLATLLAILTLLPSASLARDFISPDGALVASVEPVDKQLPGESQIEVRRRTGEVLLAKSYASPDGEHGAVIDRAEWTPDAQFFVYSMYSSGGHQPWHSPIDFYSRRRNLIVPLENRVARIVDPEFHVSPPSVIEIFGRGVTTEDQDTWFRLDLQLVD